MRNDTSECIRIFEACAKRKTVHRVAAPLREALVGHEFLDLVCLGAV